MTVGILALQGGFAEHEKMLSSLGVQSRPIKTADDFGNIDALILPGGESTTMSKFLIEEDMLDPLKRHVQSGMKVFGTCAGAILLAQLGLIDIAVERNAYGRHQESFVGTLESRVSELDGFEAVFIRAPKIASVDPDVSVLGKCREDIILVKQRSVLAATFHPELTEDETLHKFFLEQV